MSILLAADKITYYRSRIEDSPNQVQNCFTSKKNNNNNKTQLTLVGASGISKLFLRGNFGARTDCMFKTDVRLINCQIRGSQKGKD